MTIAIIIAIALGITAGFFAVPASFTPLIGPVITVGLCLLLFLIGIGVGLQNGLYTKMKEMGLRILLVPLMVGLGSIFGTITGGLLLNIPWYQAGAVGAGFGWYTFTGVELTKHSAALGTLGFTANFTRELMAILIIPFVAKHVGYLESVGPAGATGMTITLPVITRSTNPSVAIIAFLTGLILASLAPILVPFMMTLS